MGTDPKSPDRRIVPSVEGTGLYIGQAMTNITFQYDASAASGSGSGSSSSSSFAHANNKVASGMYHTCAILDNGDLKCWGLDHNGQLGDGGSTTDTTAPSSTAIDLGTGRTAVAVAWQVLSSRGLDATCLAPLLDLASRLCAAAAAAVAAESAAMARAAGAAAAAATAAMDLGAEMDVAMGEDGEDDGG